jgi:hypothetical protein
MNNISKPVDTVLGLLDGVRQTGRNQWMARCPCRNDDANPSLAISQNDEGTALLHCHRGNSCSLDEICKSIGMEPRELFADDDDEWVPAPKFEPDTRSASAKRNVGKKVETTYPYYDEEGVLLYEKVRFRLDDGGKSFANRQPDPNRPGEFIWNLKDPPVRRVLYRLPSVIKAIEAGEPVWLVEGEKDVDTLVGLGICATTMDSGAGKWDQSYTDVLSRAHVEIVADNDEVGKQHALAVASLLKAAGARGCNIWMSTVGKDITDHITAGKQIEDLVELDFYERASSLPELEEIEENDKPEDSLLAQIIDVFDKDKLTLQQKINRSVLLLNSADTQHINPNPGRLVVWQEFLEEADDESYEWVIPGILERSERVMVVAAEGVGKTMLARQVALCAAAGVHPFTFQKIPPVRTLTIDLENPERIIRRTSRSIMQQAIRHSGAKHVDAHLVVKPDGLDLTSARDRILIEQYIEQIQPQLICMGPMYKSFVDNGTRTSEALAVEVAKYLDMIRDVYGCALWLEHHAPLGTSMSSRDLRPFGSSVWSRWPEFGLALTPDPTNPSGYVYNVGHFRGARDQRDWPKQLARGTDWPFVVLEFTKHS